MKNIHPLRTERRRAERLKKLGSAKPFCLLCGCSEPMLLRPVTRKFLENHHIFGRANDSDAILALCFNCHALVTEGLFQAGVTMKRQSDPVLFAENVFRAFAVHFESLRDASARFAKQLGDESETDNHGNPRAVETTRTPDLIGYMFIWAFRLWRKHHGNVPHPALKKLEREGDWPEGTASLIMRRISADANARRELEKWVREDEQRRKQCARATVEGRVLPQSRG